MDKKTLSALFEGFTVKAENLAELVADLTDYDQVSAIKILCGTYPEIRTRYIDSFDVECYTETGTPKAKLHSVQVLKISKIHGDIRVTFRYTKLDHQGAEIGTECRDMTYSIDSWQSDKQLKFRLW